MIYILYVKIKKWYSDEEIVSSLKRIPLQKQKEIVNFKKNEDQTLHCAGWLLFQKSVEMMDLNIEMEHNLFFDKYGKPSLKNGYQFNISQSGEMAICAFTEKSRIGVDIEKKRKIDLNLFKHLFTENEWNFIQRDTNPESIFFKLWTQKESVMKADGRGFWIDSKIIHIQHNMAQISEKPSESKWFLRSVHVDPKYEISLCSETEIDSLQVKEVKFENL